MHEYIPSNTIFDLLRNVMTFIIDRPGFWLLTLIYKVFFNVANAEIFSTSVVKEVYYRIQLILGIFMIFRLSITILKAIINPEQVSAKQGGMTSIIGRVFISLVLLVVITPINIRNPKNSYEKEVANNGILFGTLYSLQYRLLEQNTLGKLILGTTSSESVSSDHAANEFGSSVVKIFITFNYKPTKEQTSSIDYENWECSSIRHDSRWNDIKRTYGYESTVETDPQEIIGLVNMNCAGESSIFNFLKRLFGSDKAKTYVFAYSPLGGIVAFVLSFILLAITVDVAIRAVKLAVLRLLAPVPIISYMSPSKDNGMFGTWVKSLTSTYLDVFIRIGIVYMVLFLLKTLLEGNVFTDTFTGLAGAISYVMIVIGLFIFAKQAPKFIKDTLGLKGMMSNVGLSALLGGAAMAGGAAKSGFSAARSDAKANGSGGFGSFMSGIGGAMRGAAGGFAQGALNGYQTDVDAYNQGKANSLGNVWKQNQDLAEQIRTGDNSAHGGIQGRMLDYLDFKNRDRAMGAMGLGRTQQALADWNEKDALQKYGDAQQAVLDRKNDLANAEADVETTKQEVGHAEDILNRYMSRVESGLETYNAATYNRLSQDVTDARGRVTIAENNVVVAETQVQAAEKDVLDAKTTYEIAQTAASKISKDRETAKVAPRVVDKYRSTYRSKTEVRDDGPPLVMEDIRDRAGNVIDSRPDRNVDSNFVSAAKRPDPFKGRPKPPTP